MSFEQTLRDRLREEAAAVPLPDREPERAVGRARTRRNHRRVVGAGLAVAVAAAVAVPRLAGDDGRPVSVVSPAESGLAPTGPLDLDWRRAEGGVYQAHSAFQDGEVVYALSTGPGVRMEDYPDGDVPRALYRLGDDGTWEPVPLDGDRPRATDVAGTGGLLYAVSTGPASEGGNADAHLSTSDDGGDTWDSEDVPAVDPPSTAVDWERSSSVGVESTGSATLAVVTTRFFPPVETMFPEMADPEGETADYSVETRDEGLVLVRYPIASGDGSGDGSGGGSEAGDPTTPPTVVREDGAPENAENPGAQVEAAAEGEDVRTIPWSELGVDGPEALATRYQLFTRADDAWEPVTPQPEAFAGLDGIQLATAGDRFVVTGWTDDDGGSTVLTSSDGVSWSPVASSPNAQIVGLGPALVKIPAEGVTLSVSSDAGASWSDVDLAEVTGVEGDSLVVASDTGPLGLALVVDARNDGGPDELVLSGDLADWTTTPLPDIVGFDDIGSVTPVVGEDRVVVTATHQVVDPAEPPPSVTAVGTPVR